MALPSTGLSLNDIYEESLPGYNHPDPLSFTAVTYLNWTEGNAGAFGASQTVLFNPYSMDGTPSAPLGADVLYGFPILDAGVDPTNFGEFRGQQYYFDGTTFDIQFSFDNTVNDIPFPPPPIDNGVNVEIKCYDYNMVYEVHPQVNINAPGGASVGAASIPGFQANTYPLVENVYWEIVVTVPDPNTTITNIAFQVNGTTRKNVGPAGGTFDWQSAGASAGVTNGTGIVYNIYVT